MFRIKVTVHILLKKRRAVNNNTLLDAQKRQKTPLIVLKSLLFIASRRTTRDFRKNSENTSRNASWLNRHMSASEISEF